MSSNFDFEQCCRFPVVVLYDGDMIAFETLDCLTIGAKSDLRVCKHGRGPFARAAIFDSNGMVWEMDGARKLHGVGPLWGYNIFLNQTIRVQPIICVEPRRAEIGTLKREVIKRLLKKDAVTVHLANLCTTIEHSEAQRTTPLVEAASSVSEIIKKLLAMDFPERAGLTSNIS